MKSDIVTAEVTSIEADWLIVFACADSDPCPVVASLDEATGGQLTRLRESGDFLGKLGEVVKLLDVPAIAAKRVALVGLGEKDQLDARSRRRATMTAARAVSEKSETTVCVALGDCADLAQSAACSMVVGSTGQAFHKADQRRFPFAGVTYRIPSNDEAIANAILRGEVIGRAVNQTRELVNRPAAEIYPETFAATAVQLCETTEIECKVFTEPELEEEQFGSMLAVAKGSDHPGCMVEMKYRGGKEGSPTLALCGKGVTFDSGGLSLKSNENMLIMKCDMAGAATVFGAMLAIAELKLPVNVTGYLGLAENMPSGTSYKLGDVLTARNGRTIEVLNTDAEGRLVLADVLSYAVDQGADRIIDLATLTGACVVALGEDVTGAFTNDQDWCDEILTAAKDVGEDVWQLPMFDVYDELIDSEVADIKNTGGRWGGAITAAKFLENFVSEKPWVHLDIAGPSFAMKSNASREGGGTGHMVETLVRVAESIGG